MTGLEEPVQPGSSQRRRRPPLSCTECRRRKLKCDRSLPCGQCVRSKTEDACVFSGIPPDSPSRRMSPPVSRMRFPGGFDEQEGATGGLFVFDSNMAPKSTSNRIAKRSRPDELHELRRRVHVLENALAKPTAPKSVVLQTPETSIYDISEVTTAHAAESTGVDDRVRFLPDAAFRGKNGHTRYSGRSHYTTTVSFFADVGAFLRQGHNVKGKGKGKGKDKDCADVKKLKRELWCRESEGHQQAFREEASKLNEMVPSRDVADQLLQSYLDGFETTHRILHIPTFLRQYSEYWAGVQPTDQAFVAQLLALMAASSCFYVPPPGRADQSTVQKLAMKWVMAVQSYISSTFVSPKINIRMIQTQCLLLLARLAVDRDGDVAWTSSGSLIRSAMTMGLHRDPTRFGELGPFWCELRRRLWSTIVELDLQISLDRGVPPSVDLDECDCDAPSNWDDSELGEDMKSNPASLPAVIYTQNYYQALMAKYLPLRYRIAKKINSLKFDLSYDDALRMGEELNRSVQDASSIFEESAAELAPNEVRRLQFAQSMYLFTMRKFLLALHRPFALSVLGLPKFSFSRKTCLEGSLEMLSQLQLELSADFSRTPHIAQLASGMLRDEMFHAALTVCVELRMQTEEMSHRSTIEGFNSGVLMSMIQSQQQIMLRAVERTVDAFASHISVERKRCKPYFFLSIILASVKSRVKGEDPMTNVEAASTRAVGVCRAILNGVPWSEAQAVLDGQLQQTPLTTMTPVASTPGEFDPVSLLSTDPSEFTPLDLGVWFDNLGQGSEVWDNDLFNSLPPL